MYKAQNYWQKNYKDKKDTALCSKNSGEENWKKKGIHTIVHKYYKYILWNVDDP